MHRWQYRTNRDSVVPFHEFILWPESEGVIRKTHSPFNSPIWPVWKCNGEWSLSVDYRGLNEVTPPLSAAVPDMLEHQYELESKAAKWYATIDMLMHSSQSLWLHSAGHSLLLLGGVFSRSGSDCPRAGKTVLPFTLDWFRLYWYREKLWNTFNTLMSSLCGATQ